MFLVPVVILPRSLELITGGRERTLSVASTSTGHDSNWEIISPYSEPFGWVETISRRLCFSSDPRGAKVIMFGLATVYESGDCIKSDWYIDFENFLLLISYVVFSFMYWLHTL